MGRVRAQRTARDVVDAASEVVAEVGLSGLSVEALAAHMRTSRSALYRFFPGKSALITAIVETRVAEVDAAIDALTAGGDREGLDGLLQLYLCYAATMPVALTADMSLLNKPSRDRISALHGRMRGACVAVIERIAGLGGPALTDPDLVADMVHSAALAGLARAPQHASSEERAQRVLALVRPWFMAA